MVSQCAGSRRAVSHSTKFSLGSRAARTAETVEAAADSVSLVTESRRPTVVSELCNSERAVSTVRMRGKAKEEKCAAIQVPTPSACWTRGRDLLVQGLAARVGSCRVAHGEGLGRGRGWVAGVAGDLGDLAGSPAISARNGAKRY